MNTLLATYGNIFTSYTDAEEPLPVTDLTADNNS